MAKKKKAAAASAAATASARHTAKREHRRQEKRKITADMWAAPAPPGLVAKLDVPKIKSKYHTYFEFAENTEKKKKLEYQVTNNAAPPPGFEYVPIGNPELTKACKELSREHDAMIFIVSGSKETNSRISDHVFRKGYHFRSTIVDEARSIIGECADTSKKNGWEHIEPIPESQEEINKQADAAIRDLFPRIPNTDRQLIIQHAFQKGARFHGEATVGLQPDIPLWRRVQLAVVAHIRHTHTRYDKLLKETSWMNARKVVEPVCLDVLVKWRGDEETGRDQLDEILREVVVITDSEIDDSSSESDSSEEDGDEDENEDEDEEERSREASLREQTINHPQCPGQWTSSQMDKLQHQKQPAPENGVALQKTNVPSMVRQKVQARKDKRAQRGFKRYQAAWEQAVSRQQRGPAPSIPLSPRYTNDQVVGSSRHPIRELSVVPTTRRPPAPTYIQTLRPYSDSSVRRHLEERAVELEPYYSRREPAQAYPTHRNEVNLHQLTDHHMQCRDETVHMRAPSYIIRDRERPAVRRLTPSGHRFQDMLVPSIESIPTEDHLAIPPHQPNSSYDPHNRFDQNRVLSRRPVEYRRESPQVITIDDDSPKVKRQRLLENGDPGYSRRIQPLSPSVGVHNEAPPHPSISGMDGQPRPHGFSSRSDQGLLHGTTQMSMQNSFIPRQDIPYRHTDNGVVIHHSNHIDNGDRFDLGPGRETAPRGEHNYERKVLSNNILSQAHPADRVGLRVVERDQISGRESDFDSRERTTRPMPTGFSIPSRFPRDEMHTTPDIADQTFIDRFSQSRLESVVPDARRDGFIVLPQRSHRTLVAQHNPPRPYIEDSTSFSAAPEHQFSAPNRDAPLQDPHRPQRVIYATSQHVGLPQRHVREQRPFVPDEGPPPVRSRTRQVVLLD